MKDRYQILVVDDKKDRLNAMEELLEKEGYNVQTSQSSRDAFEKVKCNKYHIVLIEVNLMEMDGIELLKEIKGYDALTQVIMMTECSTMDKILGSLENGANDYLLDPYTNMAKLIEAINDSIEKLERWRKSIIEIVK